MKAQILLAAAVLAAPAAATPDQQPVAEAKDPAAREAALKLARILFPEESQVTTAERLVDQTLAPTFRADESFKKIEEEHPGFTEAIIAEFRQAIGPYTRRSLPAYYDRVADLLISHLSAGEMVDLAGFYRTSTGQKLLNGMQENYSGALMVAEAADDPDKPTSFKAVTDDHEKAVRATVKRLDSSDEEVLTALARKPYFQQLQILGLAMRKLEQEFMNEPDAAFDKEIETIFERVVARFEAADHPPTD